MRLFIALNFKDEVKAQIDDIINKVKANAVQGRFVNEEHLHLTVEFLGEIPSNKLSLIKEIMDKLEFEAFTLQLTKVGYFKREEGNIYWLGIENNDTLFSIHAALRQRLIEEGFELENREYRPHITIGRKVKLRDGFNNGELDDMVRKIKIDINKVDLMKSEFANGKLRYSVMYSKHENLK